MAYNPDKHHRRSIRLPQFDYAQRGVYFVTICTHERECVLGEVIDGVMILNDWGIVADRSWDEVSTHFDGVAIDAHVVMPNHMHANIAIVHDRIRRGEVSSPVSAPIFAPVSAPVFAPVSSPIPAPIPASAPATRRVAGQGGETPPLQPTLGQIVAYYKYLTTKTINLMRGMPGVRLWQRNYWEHVIRNDAEMNLIREYIETNPVRWSSDQLHPAALPNRFNQE